MYEVIVAFPKIKEGKSMKNILVQNGIRVAAVASTGAQVIALANELDSGIILCGYRFRDMYSRDLHDYLPKGFAMLLAASPARLQDIVGSDIVCLSMPFKTFELIGTIEMMANEYRRKRKKERALPQSRSEEENLIIGKAKTLLIERNNMSEAEAHRYLQKTSMDNGTNLVETSQMILSIM